MNMKPFKILTVISILSMMFLTTTFAAETETIIISEDELEEILNEEAPEYVEELLLSFESKESLGVIGYEEQIVYNSDDDTMTFIIDKPKVVMYEELQNIEQRVKDKIDIEDNALIDMIKDFIVSGDEKLESELRLANGESAQVSLEAKDNVEQMQFIKSTNIGLVIAKNEALIFKDSLNLNEFKVVRVVRNDKLYSNMIYVISVAIGLMAVGLYLKFKFK